MLNVIRKHAESGIAVVEVNSRYHVVRISNGQVFSELTSDSPASGCWLANANAEGVRYVSKGRTETAALAGFRRQVRQYEETFGRIG